MSDPFDRHWKIIDEIIPRARRYYAEQGHQRPDFAARSACMIHKFSPTEQELSDIIEAIRI